MGVTLARAVVAASVVVGVLAVPGRVAAAPSVPGGRIVYVCGADLCAVDPATGGQQQITTDGRGYSTPDVTADGSLVAADVNDDVVVGAYGTNLPEVWAPSRSVTDVAIAPDGSGVAESHSYVTSEYCYPYGLCLVAHNDTDYTPRGAPGTGPTYNGGNGAAFTGSGALLSGTYDLSRDLHAICVVAAPAAVDQECREVMNGPAAFTAFDVSPDGSWIASTVTPEVPEGQTAVSSVAVYSSAVGTATPAQPSRVIADNAGSPTFSPDGSWIAYAADDGWIYAAPVAGGAPVKLALGTSPAWGGGTIAVSGNPTDPSAPGKAGIVKPNGVIKVKRNKVPVTVSCAAGAPCAGTVTVSLKGKALTKPVAYKIRPGARSTLRAKLTKRGARLLPSGRVVKATFAVDGTKVRIKIRR